MDLSVPPADPRDAARTAAEPEVRAALELMPQLVWTTTPDGYHDYYNEQWYRYTGMPRPGDPSARAEGWNWKTYLHPDDYDRTVAVWAHCLATGAPYEIEYRFKEAATGAYRWFLGRALPMRDAEGRIVRWFGTCTDVDEQRRAAEQLERQAGELARANAALREAERRARFLADLGQALQPLTDPGALMAATARLLGEHLGVDRCAYAEVEADEDHFTVVGDYTRGNTPSIVGRWAMSAFGEEALRLMRADRPYVVDDAEADPRVTAADRAAYAAAEIRAVISVPLHKAGRFAAGMAVHQRAPRRWAPDEVALVVTVVQRCWESIERARALRALAEREAALRTASAELAERTQVAEEARAAADEARRAAEAANAAKSQFLATMSHELRTPLNAIAGYTELLAMGVRGPLTEAQRADLERLRRANQHLTALVTDVLNFARLDAGRVEFRAEPVRLGPLVADLEALVGPQLAAKRLAYDHDACGPDTPDRPHVARADAEKVRQVLLNLLTNAIKFTAPGGRVALACEDDAAAGVVRVRVVDTGRGIPPERLAHVFEPFVQVDRDLTHASQQGVGLGLAISRDLARGMGGDLTAESEAGRGSTFTLALPRA